MIKSKPIHALSFDELREREKDSRNAAEFWRAAGDQDQADVYAYRALLYKTRICQLIAKGVNTDDGR
ncbi:MAG: hypothetical protein RSB98_04750 [Raoultibacter sp.]